MFAMGMRMNPYLSGARYRALLASEFGSRESEAQPVQGMYKTLI